MSYFDVYTKRINRYGTNLQERVQGKREHDFEVFMKRSPNLVRARNGEDENVYKAVLQTKEYDQDEVTDYLLVPLNNKIEMGTIIYTADPRHDDVDYEGTRHYIMDDGVVHSARRWINYAVDPYTSAGYNRYTVVELESELLWVDEGIKYSSFAHAVGGGSGARDKNINLKFNTQFSEAGVYLPNKRYSIVMPTHPHLKKNMKITLGGETWRVTGFDSISVKGVSYVTLEETLTDKKEDLPIANADQFDKWTFSTSRGDNFNVRTGSLIDVELFFYYNGERKIVDFEILESKDCSYSKTKEQTVTIDTTNHFTGKTVMQVFVKDIGENGRLFETTFFSDTYIKSSFSVEGSNEIYVGQTETFILRNVVSMDWISLQNSTASIIRPIEEGRDDYGTYFIVKIKGNKIGKNKIIIENPSSTGSSLDNDEFNFEVKSMWLGGNE